MGVADANSVERGNPEWKLLIEVNIIMGHCAVEQQCHFWDCRLVAKHLSARLLTIRYTQHLVVCSSFDFSC